MNKTKLILKILFHLEIISQVWVKFHYLIDNHNKFKMKFQLLIIKKWKFLMNNLRLPSKHQKE
jgi:hypothetical protein